MDCARASYTINHNHQNQRITWQDTYDRKISIHPSTFLLGVLPFLHRPPYLTLISYLKMILENYNKNIGRFLPYKELTIKENKGDVIFDIFYLFFSSTDNAIAARTWCIKNLSATSCAYRKNKKKSQSLLKQKKEKKKKVKNLNYYLHIYKSYVQSEINNGWSIWGCTT